MPELQTRPKSSLIILYPSKTRHPLYFVGYEDLLGVQKFSLRFRWADNRQYRKAAPQSLVGFCEMSALLNPYPPEVTYPLKKVNFESMIFLYPFGGIWICSPEGIQIHIY